MELAPVAVLFARRGSVYFDLASEVYDESRDARNYSGSLPVVAHPPCRGWGRLRQFAHVAPGELELARMSVWAVRRWGGVLEHPAKSSLWRDMSIPLRGVDSFGGFTFPVLQSAFGHRAPKATWLYICGIRAADIPSFPFQLGVAPGRVELMGRAEREATPIEFANWLLSIAASSRRDSPHLATRK
jgi:hypothetical protein